MRKSILIAVMAFFTMSFITTSTPTDADRLTGIWTPSSGKARVKISKIGSKYYGKIIWLKEAIDPDTIGAADDVPLNSSVYSLLIPSRS